MKNKLFQLGFVLLVVVFSGCQSSIQTVLSTRTYSATAYQTNNINQVVTAPTPSSTSTITLPVTTATMVTTMPVPTYTASTTLPALTSTVTSIAPVPTSFVTATASPITVTTTVLPNGMSAFRGSVTWGGLFQANATVYASTQNPAVMYPVGQTYRVKTSAGGSYLLVVPPGSYYIGNSLQGSNYITYSTNGGNLILSNTYPVGVGQTTQVNLTAVDWSITLISPGISTYLFTSQNTLSTSTPVLTWAAYDWSKYDGNVGYYMVEVGIYSNGLVTVFNNRANTPTYSVTTPLVSGNYEWDVRAYSSSGIEIAGTGSDFYFCVP